MSKLKKAITINLRVEKQNVPIDIPVTIGVGGEEVETTVTKKIDLDEEIDVEVFVTLTVDEIVQFISECNRYEKEEIISTLQMKDESIFHADTYYELDKFRIFKSHQSKFTPHQLENLLSTQ